MKPDITSRFMSFLILSLMPFSVDAQGISSNKFNAYDRAINEILGQLGDKQRQIDSLNNSLLELNEIKDEREKHSKLEQIIADVEAKINASQDSISSLSESLEQVRVEFRQIRDENGQLNERLTKIEQLFEEAKGTELVVRDEDSKPALFNLSTLQMYKNYLPSDFECQKYGNILEKVPDRKISAFYTKSESGIISICKVEYGAANWSTARAGVADRAHVISLE